MNEAANLSVGHYSFRGEGDEALEVAASLETTRGKREGEKGREGEREVLTEVEYSIFFFPPP